MTRPKLLTAYGRKQLEKARKAALAGTPWALLSLLGLLLLSGCVTAARGECVRLPDGSFTCSGEVNGM